MEKAAPAEKSTILIADDDGPFRSLAAIVLRGAGYAVTEARDGTEAIQKITDGDFDMVLLDIRMPGASGWEILRKMAADGTAEAPPSRALMMTGLTTEFDLDRLKREGAQGMLIKPFQNEDLLAEVRRIMALPRVSVDSGGTATSP